MADIRSNFLGIQSPNPFWLASAPPTDKEINVTRAFEAGWGGVVWKTLGEDPAVVNVNGALRRELSVLLRAEKLREFEVDEAADGVAVAIEQFLL